MSARDAAEYLGFSRRSEGSVLELYRKHGITPPKRVNQYGAPLEERDAADEAIDEMLGYAPPSQGDVAAGNASDADVETAVILSDLHFPFHDSRAIGVALAFIEDTKPETIYLAGDIVDFYALSRFSKDARRELELQTELDTTVEFLDALRRSAPLSRIVFIEGNHEARLSAYLQDPMRRALSGLRVLDIRELLSLDVFGIEYVDSIARTAFAEEGIVKVGHFNAVNKFSAYTAKNLLDRYMCSLVQGHTHRLGTHYRTVAGLGTFVAAENGCLCQLEPEYASNPDWQHGFTVITRVKESNRFHLQQVPIVDYEALFGHRRYTA